MVTVERWEGAVQDDDDRALCRPGALFFWTIDEGGSHLRFRRVGDEVAS
mgnify:CR=1 FL=1